MTGKRQVFFMWIPISKAHAPSIPLLTGHKLAAVAGSLHAIPSPATGWRTGRHAPDKPNAKVKRRP